MKQLSKREAAAALGISLRTLHNRMKSGQVKFTKVPGAAVGEQSVFFTYEDLGLPEPARDVRSATAETCKPAPKQEPALNLSEGLRPLETNPETYRDSFGHRITGNPEHRMFETRYEIREPSQSHIDPSLLGTSRVMYGTDGEIVQHAGSTNHPLLKNFKPVESARPPMPHPNENRQAFLDLLLRDVSRGWSR